MIYFPPALFASLIEKEIAHQLKPPCNGKLAGQGNVLVVFPVHHFISLVIMGIRPVISIVVTDTNEFLRKVRKHIRIKISYATSTDVTSVRSVSYYHNK